MATIDIAVERREFWRKLGVRWKTGYWATGALAALFAALGTMPDIMGISSKIFAGIATAILACTGFADPLKQFNQRMKGYWILDDAILKHPSEKDRDKAEADLIKAIGDADKAANGQ